MFFVCCFSFSLGSYSTCLQVVSVVNTTISLSLLLVLLFDAPPSTAALSTSAWRCFFGSCFRKTTTICFAGFCGLNISRLYRSSRHRLQICYAVRSLLQFCSIVGVAEASPSSTCSCCSRFCFVYFVVFFVFQVFFLAISFFPSMIDDAMLCYDYNGKK
jgi:hypothetical protein